MAVSPRVSIVVPVFNGGQRLAGSIESLLSQTLKDVEIIIVDDASTDDTAAVIRKIAERNDNVISIRLSENKGAHEARLAGLKVATAPWLGFLDADDFARPKMFESLLVAAKENDVDIVVCGIDRVSETRRSIAPKVRFGRSEKIERGVFDEFCAFAFGTGSLCNKLYSRRVIEPCFNLHFPWRQEINEDLILSAGCFYRAKSIYLLTEILYEYVSHNESVTSRLKADAAFVYTFRAFAVAVSVFKDFTPEAQDSIIDMYRVQFSSEDYQIENVRELAAYGEQIAEAVSLVARTNPAALGFLSARKKPRHVDLRLALRAIFHQFKRRLPYTGARR